jgi:hypothetical protein
MKLLIDGSNDIVLIASDSRVSDAFILLENDDGGEIEFTIEMQHQLLKWLINHLD